MARQITITDNLVSIQMTITQDYPSALSATTNIAKSNIVSVEFISDTDICLVQYEERPNIHLNWNEVVAPVVASGADLYAAMLLMINNVPGAGFFVETDTFTDADLVGGILTITHTYATTNVFVVIKDAGGVIVDGVPKTVIDNATVEVDFGGSIGAGTWSYILVAII